MWGVLCSAGCSPLASTCQVPVPQPLPVTADMSPDTDTCPRVCVWGGAGQLRACGQSRKGQGTQAGCPQQPAPWPQSMWRRPGSSVDRTPSGVPSGAALCPPGISLVCSFTTFGSRINRDKWKAQQAAVVCPACGTPPRTRPSSSPLGGTAPRDKGAAPPPSAFGCQMHWEGRLRQPGRRQHGVGGSHPGPTRKAEQRRHLAGAGGGAGGRDPLPAAAPVVPGPSGGRGGGHPPARSSRGGLRDLC